MYTFTTKYYAKLAFYALILIIHGFNNRLLNSVDFQDIYVSSEYKTECV